VAPEHDDPASSICLIAGGIGITPMISMLYQLEKEHRTNPIELFYAVNSGADHAFAKELSELKKTLPQFKVTTFYSMPIQADIDSKSFDFEGRMSIQYLLDKLKDSSTHYYLCGPGGMISSMIQALEENGVDEARIHMEAFGPSSKQKSKLKPSPQLITLLKSGKTLTWNPESSLLKLIEDAEVKASSGCRVGQCESCSVKLVAGNVSYPDGINTPPAGECLLCVAIPLGPLSLNI
ncbi:MAG TPA: iron-sulfur cluster-binding domain-containing protein, partial [Methylobacter sp.]